MNSKLTLERRRDPDSINHWFSSRRLILDKWDFTVNGPTEYKEREYLCKKDANTIDYYTTVSMWCDEVQINRVAIKRASVFVQVVAGEPFQFLM